MPIQRANVVFNRIVTLVAKQDLEQSTDAELAGRFALSRDAAAFEVLVKRHGPTILRHCRRLLGCEHDAEDVFQATFLVFARKASTLKKSASIGSWLFGVASRLAAKSRASSRRRPDKDATIPVVASSEEVLASMSVLEAGRILHEELAGLPVRLRDPLVLCHLEGKTRDEAARALGCTLGTLKDRLLRGKNLLRTRLTRRGVGLPAAMIANLLTEIVSDASVSDTLLQTVVRATGGPAGATGMSIQVATLVEAGIRGLSSSPSKLTACLVASTLMIGSVIAWTAFNPAQAQPNSLVVVAADDKKPIQETKGKEANRLDVLAEQLPEGALARFGGARFHHEGNAEFVQFSPDGKVLAATTEHGKIYLWDALTGREIRTLINKSWARFPHRVIGIDFSRDGKFLASSWSDQSVRISEVGTGKETQTFRTGKFPSANPGQVRYTPDGKEVIVAASFGQRPYLLIFNSETGKHTHSLDPFQNRGSFTFSPEGNMLAVLVGDNSPEIELFDVATWKSLRTMPADFARRRLSFSPDGRMLAWDTKDHIALADVATGNPVGKLVAPMDRLVGMEFTPDNKSFITATQDGDVIFWDLATKKVRFRKDTRKWKIRSLALSPDGKTVAVGTINSVIRLWDVASGRELFDEPNAFDAPIHSVAFSPNGRSLAIGGDNHNVSFWHVDSEQPRQRCKSPDSAQSVAYSPDGRFLASADANSPIIRLWNAVTGELSGEVKTKESGVKCIAFSPDGRRLASAHALDPIRGAKLNVWEVNTGKNVREFTLQPIDLQALVYSADERTLVLGTKTGAILVWDLTRGRETSRLTGHEESITSLALTPDGRVLASASMDRTIKLWNIASGNEMFSLKGHERAVAAIAFSPNGLLLASAGGTPDYSDHCGRSPRIRFWEVATGQEIAHLEGQRSDVTALAFSPDARRLASGLRDAAVLLWDLNSSLPAIALKPNRIDDEEQIWNDLGSANARTAYKAVGALTADPQTAIPLLRKRLRPVTDLDPQQVRQWIGDLDGDDYRAREAASRELKNLNERVEPDLHKALAANPPEEVRRRIILLLASAARIRNIDTLRAIRATQVLEAIGSSDATELLEMLATGAPTSHVTQAAKSTLTRQARLRAMAEKRE